MLPSSYFKNTSDNAKQISILTTSAEVEVRKSHYLSGGGVNELKVGMRAGAGTDALASPKVRVAVTSSGILHDTLLYFD